MISEFWTTCACPEKQSCPELFHCVEIFFIFQDFWATCAWPEKHSLPWKFSLHWMYFFPFTRFLSKFALALRNSLPRNFSLHWTYFLHSGFLSNLRLPWKTECALNSLYLIYIFIIQNFEQHALALKNTVCPVIFNCVEIFFIFQDFWANCACPENRVCPEFFKLGGAAAPRLVRHRLAHYWGP